MPPNYDLIVLGGGSAGLTAAVMSAGLGARTLLVERHKLGGDCLHTGCIPSKALIRSANVASLVHRAAEFGLDVPLSSVDFPRVDFPRVMERVADVIRTIEPHDSPEHLATRGVEVRFGEARFLSPREITLNGETLRSRKFVIATGSRPAVPPMEGLRGYLTNENVFELRKRPEHLIVLGAGPIGAEMAQAFRRLGSLVTLLDMAPRVLPREDPDVSALITSVFEQEGIRVCVSAKVIRDTVREPGPGETEPLTEHRIDFEHGGKRETIGGDALLIAVGRRPNVEGLDLEKAGVAVESQGIPTNARCRTTTSNIYACGDVAGRFLFTHTAEYEAKVAVTNAILHIPMKLDYRAVPWVTFTDPEAARVGLTEEEARRQHGAVKVHRITLNREDRSLTDGETEGLVKVIATPKGRVLGAHIVSPRAGEMILEYTLAMQHSIPLAKLSSTIHPYPTFALAARHAADLYWREKASPTLIRWLQRIFGYSGTIPGN